MNTADFVKVVKTIVSDAAARGVGEVLEQPSGRKPDQKLMELSRGFLKLSDSDRENIRDIVVLAANQATYNFLLALDGRLAIDPSEDRGSLQLFFASPTDGIVIARSE